ncbi:hypothetical protein AWC38_SpisGene9512 [Stylophora pistillata]|uniref:DUF1758 domain-containing protein n=1 Tax=Stylophora pistillata TaxID=50429 RepID=A0A2B4SBA4_STYPI|nr:hypothetical protein AWC38_SpisGene9512 [Stylophora pistillata]
MAEKLPRTRAKRGGNSTIMTKLMNEADGLLKAEPRDKKRLKAIATSLNERLNLVNTLDEEIIENCAGEEAEAEMEESDEINSRVIDLLLVINEATGSMDNNDGLSIVLTTNIDDTMPTGSQQSITPSGSSGTSTLASKYNVQLQLPAYGYRRHIWMKCLKFQHLPHEVRIQVARSTVHEVWEMSSLSKVIRQEVEAREISEGVETDVSFEKLYPNHHKTPTANAYLSQDGKRFSLTENQIKCVYCGVFHYSASCENVSDLYARFEILRKGRRCFVCLKTDHHGSSCKRNHRRFEGHHHQSICRKFVSKTPDYSSDSSGLDDQNSREGQNSTLVSHASEPIVNEIDQVTNREEGSETPFLGSTVTATSTPRARGSILLQTATAIATNEDRSKSIPVRILFDIGSQRSYVTDHIKAKLGLTTTSTETLRLNTFGENAYRKQNCQVVTLPLQSNRDEYVEISVLNFPAIFSPLPKRMDVKKYPHLVDLNLADRSAFDQGSIDILIGSDYYWDIVTRESIRGEFGPTAINSKFGWLLSGSTEE